MNHDIDSIQVGRKQPILSKIGYVVGRYHSTTNTYEYYVSNDSWTTYLEFIRVFRAPEHVNMKDMIPKGKRYRYSLSKVFYTLDTRYSADKKIGNIKLTKPNFYEKMCAVVNNI